MICSNGVLGGGPGGLLLLFPRNMARSGFISCWSAVLGASTGAGVGLFAPTLNIFLSASAGSEIGVGCTETSGKASDDL